MKRILLALTLVSASCGTEQPVADNVGGGDNGSDGGVTPDPSPGDGKTSYARITQIHEQYCVSCHGGSDFIKGEAELKRSSAKTRVQNDNMPLGAKLPPAVKEEYLNFFSA